MKKFTFDEFKNIREKFLSENKDDFTLIIGSNNILISAPHGVSQVRLGRLKVPELGTIPIAYLLSQNTNSNLIVKTQNLNDDVSFDTSSKYRDEIQYLIKTKRCKYLFDIHGMAKTRQVDVNLGINFGQNIKADKKLLDILVNNLKLENFSFTIDQPFCGRPQTISGHFAKKSSVWAIQVEINCAITNDPNNIDKCNHLVETLIKTINEISKARK